MKLPIYYKEVRNIDGKLFSTFVARYIVGVEYKVGKYVKPIVAPGSKLFIWKSQSDYDSGELWTCHARGVVPGKLLSHYEDDLCAIIDKEEWIRTVKERSCGNDKLFGCLWADEVCLIERIK